MYALFRLTDRIFDDLEARWESDSGRRSTANLLIFVFLATLVVIELKRQGLLPAVLAELVPSSHFAAVSLAFTFFLIIEIIGLVFALAQSVANAAGKQFEIFSLILLREAFKEFAYFGEPIVWDEIREPVLHMLADAGGALVIFVLIGFYYRAQLHRPITAGAAEQTRFVTAKKAIALLLLAAFVFIGVNDLWRLVTNQPVYPFFKTFYTVLIFSDVLIVLISLRYTATYHVVFRNSGFALATVILRIALAAPVYINVLLGIAASGFILGLTYAYNTFGAVRVRDETHAPRSNALPASTVSEPVA
jgi:hypothetical protein